MNDEYLYKIQAADFVIEHWHWACDNLDIGAWKVSHSFRFINGVSPCTYWFKCEADLLMFKLSVDI